MDERQQSDGIETRCCEFNPADFTFSFSPVAIPIHPDIAKQLFELYEKHKNDPKPVKEYDDERPIDVYIREAASGITHIYQTEGHFAISEYEDGSKEEYFRAYWWEDGSGGCDCNRSSFFAYAHPDYDPDAEDDDDDDDEDQCCTSGRYVVDKITPRDQPDTILYSDSNRDREPMQVEVDILEDQPES